MLVTVGTLVSVSESARRFPTYGNLLGLSGTVQGIDIATAAGAIATVSFVRRDGTTLEAHVPTRFLAAVEPEEPRAPRLTLREPKDPRTEEQKQGECVAFLRNLGYRVTVTGKRPVPATCGACTSENGGRAQPVLCPRHKRVVYSQVGNNTAGLADLIITHPTRWAPAGARRPSIEQEWKRESNSPRQPGQPERAQEGTSAIVWTLQMSLEDIVRFEQIIGAQPHPEITAWLQAKQDRKP